MWETQNCEKWSLISETILPLVILASTLLVKIFSIKVVELLCTRVGLSVVGIIESFAEKVKIPEHGESCRREGDLCWSPPWYKLICLKLLVRLVFQEFRQKILGTVSENCAVYIQYRKWCYFFVTIGFQSIAPGKHINFVFFFNNCILQRFINIH